MISCAKGACIGQRKRLKTMSTDTSTSTSTGQQTSKILTNVVSSERGSGCRVLYSKGYVKYGEMMMRKEQYFMYV